MPFPVFRQKEEIDCGPACLFMLASFYKKNISFNELKEKCQMVENGTTLSSLSRTAEEIGFETNCVKLNLTKLFDVQLPAILHWNKNHYVVLYKIVQDKFYLADPAWGLVHYDTNTFKKKWISGKFRNEHIGIIITLSLKD